MHFHYALRIVCSMIIPVLDELQGGKCPERFQKEQRTSAMTDYLGGWSPLWFCESVVGMCGSSMKWFLWEPRYSLCMCHMHVCLCIIWCCIVLYMHHTEECCVNIKPWTDNLALSSVQFLGAPRKSCAGTSSPDLKTLLPILNTPLTLLSPQSH